MAIDEAMTWYPAPGKLNLFLHVLGRRETGEHAGYHELQTLFRLVDRTDRVGVSLRGDGQVRFSGEFGDQNLCIRAARLLKEETRTSLGCDLALEKILPIGGGMGGGSSDAATVLLALNRLWNLHLERKRLMQIGLKLGADVPIFLFGKNALGEGIGERLTPIPLPDAWYLVLEPQVSVSTKEIFKNALTHTGKGIKIPPFFPGLGRNDLEPIVTARYPEVAAHLAWLKSRCPQARMTGSGAGVFAEFAAEGEARALQSELPDTMRGFVARGIEQHPLHDWAN
jgi:4-diphosphocytidyl-2-C-methyl-D-erythritol kinase